MATWAIGDVQGCFVTFERLLAQVGFDPARDRLWLVGDLVNRGPRSLTTLRWLYEHQDAVTAVLGNHDLHLLAVAAGAHHTKQGDTLAPLLDAPDRDRLLQWVASLPLLHREGNRVMVHAGLLPRWSIDEAVSRARAVEAALRAPGGPRILDRRAELEPKLAEVRDDLAVLTRIRMVNAAGEADYAHNGPPEDAPRGQRPWFAHPRAAWAGTTVVFGHWAALGLRVQPGIVALDSGCVWRQTLSAYRLEDGTVVQAPYADG